MWYKKSEKIKKEYVGDCVTCLDDEWFTENIANDATELAQISDQFEDNPNIQQIDFNAMLVLCNVPNEMLALISQSPSNYEFYINNRYGLAWIYNINTDTHYFYH